MFGDEHRSSLYALMWYNVRKAWKECFTRVLNVFTVIYENGFVLQLIQFPSKHAKLSCTLIWRYDNIKLILLKPREL